MALTVKSDAQRVHSQSSAGNLNVDMLKRFFDRLVDAAVLFTDVAGVTGIAQFVKDQKGDQGLNPVTEFNAMRTEVTATLNWLRTNMPSGTFSSNTYYLAYDLPVDNVTKSGLLTFTSGQTGALRTQLDALIATIS